MSKIRDTRRGFRAATVILASLASLGVAEAAVRTYLAVAPPRLRLDEALGWRCVEGYSWTGTVADAAGRRRAITYSTDKDGFRAFGHLGSRRPRVLVLGDSFTQATAAADDETYFALLREKLGAEVFAYGAGGYGTLQELMVLERVAARIRPDLVVWQFCTNDFINNDLALESASAWDNNGMRRPYLDASGAARYATPKRMGWVRSYAGPSRLVWGLSLAGDRLLAPCWPTVETEIAAQGAAHAGFARAAATTEELLRRVKRRAGATPVVVFCADAREPYSSALAAIAARCGLDYAAGVPGALLAARRRGVETRAADFAHWNDAGHRVVADALAPAAEAALRRPRR